MVSKDPLMPTMCGQRGQLIVGVQRNRLGLSRHKYSFSSRPCPGCFTCGGA